MSYAERIRQIRYTSPLGATFEPYYDSLARSGGKKAAVTELPEQDSPDVRDLGESAQKFAMGLYFTGPDYDREADAFWNALVERGPGVLAHPRWGDIRVLPVSRSQSEEFVDGLGRAVFEVEFVRLSNIPFLPNIAPFAIINQAASVLAAASRLVVLTVQNFKALNKIVTSPQESLAATEIGQNLTNTIGFVTAELSPEGQTKLAKVPLSGDSQKRFQSLNDVFTILSEDDIPIQRKIFAIEQALASFETNAETNLDRSIETSSSIAAANAVCRAAGEYDSSETRRALINSASRIIEIRESIFARINGFDEQTGFTFDESTLSDVYSNSLVAASMLFNAGLKAALERTMILDRESTILNIYYSLNGSLEDLDSFVELNDFQGDEFFLLRPGREIRYYESVS